MLEQLPHGVRPLAPASAWPPAPTWLLLLAGVVVLTLLAYFAWRWWQRRPVAQVYRRWVDQPLTTAKALAAMTVDLKRLLGDANALHGADWLAHLDQQVTDSNLARYDQAWQQTMYQAAPPDPELVAALQQWLRQYYRLHRGRR